MVLRTTSDPAPLIRCCHDNVCRGGMKPVRNLACHRLRHYLQPGALAEPRQHRKMGLLSGVVLGNVMPAHAGDGGALRRTWKAATAGGARRSLRLHLEMKVGVLRLENAHQRYEATSKAIPRGDDWLHEPKLDGYRFQ